MERIEKENLREPKWGPWVFVIVCLMFVQRFWTANLIWWPGWLFWAYHSVCAQMNHACALCMNTIETKRHALGKLKIALIAHWKHEPRSRNRCENNYYRFFSLLFDQMTWAKNTRRTLNQNNGRDSKINWPNHKIHWKNRRESFATGN